MILYLSHTAGDDRDWWIVEPRDDPAQQVEDLLRVGRRVLRVNTDTALELVPMASEEQGA